MIRFSLLHFLKDLSYLSETVIVVDVIEVIRLLAFLTSTALM